MNEHEQGSLHYNPGNENDKDRDLEQVNGGSQGDMNDYDHGDGFLHYDPESDPLETTISPKILPRNILSPSTNNINNINNSPAQKRVTKTPRVPRIQGQESETAEQLAAWEGRLRNKIMDNQELHMRILRFEVC